MNKHVITSIFLLTIFSCTDRTQDNHSTIPAGITGADSFAAPKVTVLADLPDSLQPKITLGDTAPKPLTVAVPTRSGGSYSITTFTGELRKIALEPPVNKPLPVLKNVKGETIKDSAGNPFIMGDGGKSHFTSFTTNDGLALDGVRCSHMDQRGNLWFGTSGGGLSRYDGKSFVTFTTTQGLAANLVWSIEEDRAGILWFGTNGGLSRYDGKSFVTFTTAQGLANNSVWSIAEDRAGILWVGTSGGLSRYDPSASLSSGTPSFVTFTTAQGLANNSVWSIVEDRAGNLWFGTNGGGLSRYDGKSFVTFSTDQGLGNNRVFSIAEDRKGNLWFGIQGGLSRYDGKSFVTFTTAHGLPNNSVNSIAEDRNGNLWVGTYGGGLSRYDGKSFVTYTTAQGLANNTVWSVTEDRAGNLWIGTQGGGLSRYDPSAPLPTGIPSFVTFSTAQGLAHNNVWSIAEDRRGNHWFGTYGGGLSRYDGKSFVTFSAAQGLADNYIFSIAEDRAGNLWFGTYGGVSRYDGKSFVTFTTAQGLAKNTVNSIAEDRAGNLWFCTYGGVSRYDGKSFVTYTTAQGLANNIVYSIDEDRVGNLWFGTAGGGLSRYDGKSFVTFSTAQGLVSNTVYSIAEDRAGNLWFGTEEGLSVLPYEPLNRLAIKPALSVAGGSKNSKSHNKPPGPVFKTFTKTDGLPDNFVTQVFQMPDGKMAVGTNLGITMFKPSADFSSLQDIEIYNSGTGYPVKDVNTGQHCMFLDSQGIVWAGTGSEITALVRFDPSALHKDTAAPTMMIQSIKVGGENISWYDLLPDRSAKIRGDSQSVPPHITEEVTTFGHELTQKDRDTMKQKFGDIKFDSITPFYPVPQHLVLPFRHNHITIDFNAVETGRPKLVRYQYILEGYDKEWSPILANSSAAFGNMGEGNYTFKVKARGPNGVWSVPVTYSFKVLPPWYRTWWAYLIYALLFLGALRIFSKWRERNLRHEKERLEHKVEERTEELVQKNIVVEEQKEELVQKNRVVEAERQRSEELLLNILPEEVAAELKATGTAKAKQFDDVTVLFTDFVDFTSAGERMSPQALIDELHTCFKAFDEITAKYNIEKIKTIGDAYLAVAGLPVSDANHAVNTVQAAIEINKFIEKRLATQGSSSFQIRIGIHSGSVVAGIVGVKKFAYDIWGDTVNTAARMEQSGEAGKINISQSTYELVKDQFNCKSRGEIAAKHKGQLKMYFVDSTLL